VTNGDVERARQIYQECLKLIPHRKWTFGKIWILKAQFEIRQMQLQAARKTLGQAIGMCPKDKLFKGYIELEKQLYEFTRCRTLFEKQLEWNPSNSQAWIQFAELERSLDDLDRARAIFELGIEQPTLDMPELVWKAYIDFEEYEGEYERARDLYERLLRKTDHVKVWINYAKFEINVPDSEEEEEERPVSEEAKARARKVFQRAHDVFKTQDLKDERVDLLNAWKSFESTHGSKEDMEGIEQQLPRRVKKRRKLDDDQFEEYLDYVFPADDESAAKMSKLLQMAHAWKQQQTATNGANGACA
jgi:crooked neck